MRERVGVGALQHAVYGIRNRRDGDGRGDARIEVLRDLLGARDDRPLDGSGALVATNGIVRRVQCLELGHRRPLGVDRKPAAIRQHEAELDDLAVDAYIRGQHARRQVGEVLAQDVLPRPALRGTAGQHGGEPPHDLALLGVGRPPLLVTDAEFLEGSPSAVEALTELFGGELALRRRVGQPAELGCLDVERRSNVVFGPATAPRGQRRAGHGADEPSDQHPDPDVDAHT